MKRTAQSSNVEGGLDINISNLIYVTLLQDMKTKSCIKCAYCRNVKSLLSNIILIANKEYNKCKTYTQKWRLHCSTGTH